VDLGEFGIEITFLDYSKVKYSGEEATYIIQDLKSQIRARPEWTRRVEPWEAMEREVGIYENAPHLEGRVYSFEKEMRILRSRMTRKEKEEFGG
jgi:hypothetical protein